MRNFLDKAYLHVKDELNLYLVEHYLKPAAVATLSVTNGSLEDTAQHVENSGELTVTTLHLPHGLREAFQDRLRRAGLRFREDEIVVEADSDLEHLVRYDYRYLVAKSLWNKHKLWTAKNDWQRGLALGYPKQAVKAHLYPPDGMVRNEDYLMGKVREARKAGIQVPSWLAYISWVPERLDLFNSDVSKSSRALGTSYMNYVRSNNPQLADAVEREFFRQPN